MKIAPLIYSRTEQHEYFFAVRPDSFESVDPFITRAKDEIISLVNDVQRIKGRRFLVLSKNGFCIAGVACVMKYFIADGKLNPDEKAEAKTYELVDQNSRRYGIFLGYVFKGNGNEIPVVTDSDLWQMFKKNLAPNWNDKNVSGKKGYGFDCTGKPAPAKRIASQKYCGVTLYDASKISAAALFEEYLARAENEKVAFCSDVDSLSAVENKIFTAASTSQDIIDILKKRNDNEQKPQVQSVQEPQIEYQSEPEQIQTVTQKKNRIRPKNNNIIKKINKSKPIQWIRKKFFSLF